MIKEFLTPELLQRYGPTLPVSQEDDSSADTDTACDKGIITTEERAEQSAPPRGPIYWSTLFGRS